MKEELDFLKKRLGHSVEDLRAMIEPSHPELSISQQCSLLGLARSSYYYESGADVREALALMRLLDDQYLRTPFYGIRRMREFLRRQGYLVNHKRVERLRRLMGLQAIYPRKRCVHRAVMEECEV